MRSWRPWVLDLSALRRRFDQYQTSLVAGGRKLSPMSVLTLKQTVWTLLYRTGGRYGQKPKEQDSKRLQVYITKVDLLLNPSFINR
jgi:hypothetical protein